MFRDCTWLENKQEEEEEEKKKNIAPSMCCRSNIHPWCVPWKTRPFSFSTFIRRSFSVRSFVFISRIRRWGISDAWKRVIDFFSPLFPLFHSFDFFFPFFFFSSFLRLRPATLTLIRRRATIFIDNCLPLQEFCLQEFWHARDENY